MTTEKQNLINLAEALKKAYSSDYFIGFAQGIEEASDTKGGAALIAYCLFLALGLVAGFLLAYFTIGQ